MGTAWVAPRTAAGQRRGLSTAPAQYTAFCKGIVSEWVRQGTFHLPFMPSDAHRESNQLISVRKHKAPVALSDVDPQTPLFWVKSCFNNSSSPTSGLLPTRNTPRALHLAEGANLPLDSPTLLPHRNSQDGNSQPPPQTSQSCFSSSFPSLLTCSRSHPSAFALVPASKSCSCLAFVEAAT